ncbi:hypothetical protein GUJ93_ZPchr0002g25091 [Zizania palustris]|uniref:Myb-like domain-containing protein n=1 Tax=Zizania palustris TaxID=103762 RepID=A0A8J5VUJ9_ZIZPA|nr:hypothetical protein GUJ93_ZPchr0002g26251 [Zizania palustris]KAG8060514.1 hypothetical protein GUJ93_ZPchr0002g25091 [Zizania palustris]
MEEDCYFTNLLNEGSDHERLEELGSNPNEPPSQNEEVTPIERPSHKRINNFNEKEDALLVFAWLNISMDVVQGNNQNKFKYWAHIYKYFHSNKDVSSNRSENYLNRRWRVIQENVNKFTGCVA